MEFFFTEIKRNSIIEGVHRLHCQKSQNKLSKMYPLISYFIILMIHRILHFNLFIYLKNKYDKVMVSEISRP